VTNTNVLQLSQPGAFSGPLTEVLRSGTRALLAQAVDAEVAALLSVHAEELTADGRRRLVRHGYLPEREITTGIGPVPVRCPCAPGLPHRALPRQNQAPDNESHPILQTQELLGSALSV
jgi:hypothetical protein